MYSGNRGRNGRRSGSLASEYPPMSHDGSPAPSSPPLSSPSSGLGKRNEPEESSDNSDDEQIIGPVKRRKRTMAKRPRLAVEDEEALVDIGRFFTRFCDPFYPFESILSFGLTHGGVAVDITELNRQQEVQYQLFIKLLEAPKAEKLIQRLLSKLEHVPLVSAALEKGRSKARSDDVGTLKKYYKDWPHSAPNLPPIYSKCEYFGFKHDECGMRLVPAGVVWQDVKSQYRSGEQIAKPEDLPSILWARRQFCEADPLLGFLMSEELLDCVQGIFIGPSVPSGSNRSKRQGLASLAGVRKLSFAAIAYVAVLLRFLLSDQAAFNPETATSWGYTKFYRTMLNTVEEMTRKRRDDLLQWWNERVFGVNWDSGDSDENQALAPSTNVARPGGLSLAERLKMASEKEKELEREAKEKRRAERKAWKARQALEALNAGGNIEGAGGPVTQ